MFRKKGPIPRSGLSLLKAWNDFFGSPLSSGIGNRRRKMRKILLATSLAVGALTASVIGALAAVVCTENVCW